MTQEEVIARLSVEYGVYPNFEHPDFIRPYPCQFSECEGDCAECPNLEFYAKADEAGKLIGRRGIATLLRQQADHLDALAEKYGD